MSNVFSVHQRTCLISHTSAYVGAIRRSVTGPLARKLKIMSSTAYAGTYGVILSKNCGVKSQWYMGFICPYVLFGYVARKT